MVSMKCNRGLGIWARASRGVLVALVLLSCNCEGAYGMRLRTLRRLLSRQQEQLGCDGKVCGATLSGEPIVIDPKIPPEPYQECTPLEAQDQCTHVKTVKECMDDNNLVQYLDILYCDRRPLILKAVVIFLWMCILFYTLGQVADHFLVPALKMISDRLELPSDIAGITLLAFANGAPDIFTELAAITSSERIHMGLAMSVTFGAGMFICVVVFAVIVVLSPHQVSKAARPAYIRDTFTYTATSFMMVVFMWDDIFTFAEASAMLLGYAAYLASAIMSYRSSLSSRQKPAAGDAAAAPSLELQPLSRAQDAAEAPDGLPAPAASVRPLEGNALAQTLWAEDYFSWSHLGPWERRFLLVVLPIKFVLHVSMPVVRPGIMSESYTIVLCIMAPLFTTLVLGLSPSGGDMYPFILTWFGGVVLLMLVLILYVPDVGSNPVSSHWLSALVAFVQCILWMSFLADELVALFHAIGHAFGVSQALIGGTILAWGECIADLVASLAIARSGKITMALSACFGCPILNMLGGMGLGLFYQTWASGPVHAELSQGVMLLGISSFILLSYQMLAVPLLHNWNLNRSLACILLGLYAVSQVAFVAVESNLVTL